MPPYITAFSILGLALCFCSLSLGAILAAAIRGFTQDSLPVLLHFCGVALVALRLSRSLRRHASFPRTWRPLLVATAGLCLIVPLFIHGSGALSWKVLLSPALTVCLLLPTGLYIFFATVPPERHGAALGCAMAAGELVWVAALPSLYLFQASSQNPEALVFLYKFLGFVMAGAFVCFLVPLVKMRRTASGTGADTAPVRRTPGLYDSFVEAPGPVLASSGGATALRWLFVAGVLFYTLFGLVLLAFPRLQGASPLLGNRHFLLLLATPFAGLMIDAALSSGFAPPQNAFLRLVRFPLLVRCWFVPVILAIPLLEFFAGFAHMGVLLLVLRQCLLLLLFVIISRVACGDPSTPILHSMAWGLILFHLVGFEAGARLAACPTTRFLAICLLSLACAFCLRRFAGIVKSLPLQERKPTLAAAALSPLPLSPDAKEPATILPALADSSPRSITAGDSSASFPDPISLLPATRTSLLTQAERDKQRAFAAAFDLTRREEEVLSAILQEREREAIGAALGISDSTVKFHIRSLLRKTSASNRQRLLRFYASWKAE